MKTCYTCGNKADPATYHGKRNLDRLGRKRANRDPMLDFHPLAHFGFCVRRRLWLDNSRNDCGNWTVPCQFDANRVHIELPGKVKRIVESAYPYRYGLAVSVISVGLVFALSLTAYVSG